MELIQKQGRCKVYEFTPGKRRRLKTVNKYVSPEKEMLMKQRMQAKRDKRNFFIGIGVLIMIVAALTYLSLR
ncbi:hypothetical protein L9W92_03795 [Pelotomaculum terephthalicicum JT]|uniref:hypothetical protein n=1 Tax=Pelotomaculum terephthalicicum TaxID=206393 RepID=UPI001F036D1F|nr:hypothetical protein [Pelotomaculum terephthalicicum]MCG9967177.1 hypothetical protein [Pelotomaculum terephthalicicum JT]